MLRVAFNTLILTLAFAGSFYLVLIAVALLGEYVDFGELVLRPVEYRYEARLPNGIALTDELGYSLRFKKRADADVYVLAYVRADP